MKQKCKSSKQFVRSWNSSFSLASELMRRQDHTLKPGCKTKQLYKLLYPEIPKDGEPVATNIDIYCSTNVQAAHSPGRLKVDSDLLEVAKADEYLQDGIELWQTVSIRAQNPKALGWRPTTLANGEKLYKIHIIDIYYLWS